VVVVLAGPRLYLRPGCMVYYMFFTSFLGSRLVNCLVRIRLITLNFRNVFVQEYTSSASLKFLHIPKVSTAVALSVYDHLVVCLSK
jgi:hypothetical protein